MNEIYKHRNAFMFYRAFNNAFVYIESKSNIIL